MRFLRFFFLSLFFIPLLTGCSLHQQAYCGDYPVENLKTVKPQYVAIKNGKMEYYRFGNGSPLVLIPGYATDVSSWNQNFLAALAVRHQVIVFNNRKVGGSSVTTAAYDSQALASDTYQLIQGLKLKKTAVLGISMGGMIAQKLAVLHPTTINRLVLINTAIAGGHSVHPQPAVEKEMMNIPSNKYKRYFLALRLFFPPQWRMQMGVALARDRFFPENYAETDLSPVLPLQQGFLKEWMGDQTTAKSLAQLSVPVLILNGRADQVIPPANSDILKATIPHSQLLTWQEGGHAMIYQYPEEIARAVNKFLS
jgi:pimeloyl-ACP methyl ester carboxylesterase